MSQARFVSQVVAIGAFVLACGSGESAGPDKCGNGALDPGETCDDGNRFDGDNCPANCIGSLVSFDVGTNSCPVVEQLSVLPSEAPVGTNVAISALGSDPDGGRVYYDWTSDGGGVLTHDSNSKRATFECTASGRHVITVWLFDTEGCVTSKRLVVTCT